jgi:transcriptional regulator with XRE-family HTH domain
MKELGQKLREARISKGLTHEILFEKTRIVADTIKAIEKGEVPSLPKPHYRAFVRTLAKEVGLEPEALLREYDSRQRRLAEEKSAIQVPGESHERLRQFWNTRKKQVVIWGLSCMVLILAGLYIKYGRDLFYEPDPSGMALTVLDTTRSAGFTLEVQSLQACWIEVQIDSGIQEERFLEGDQESVFYGERTIYLSIADASKVFLLLNGRQIPLLYKKNPALEVWLGPDGIKEMKERPLPIKQPVKKTVIEPTRKVLQGLVTLDALLDQYPELIQSREQYQPDSTILHQINELNKEIMLFCFLGVWDTLSMEIVPPLLRIHQMIDNNQFKLRLVAVNRKLQDPSDYFSRYIIQGVPTILFLSQDIELGRITGKPNKRLENLFLENAEKSKYLEKSYEETSPDTLFEDVGNR